MTVTIDRTAAKIGRSMKKREMFIGYSRLVGGVARPAASITTLLGVDHEPRAHALDAGDDDPVVGREPLAHDAQARRAAGRA